MPVVRADGPGDTDLFAERLELGAAAVIENMDRDLVRRIVDGKRRVDGRLDHAARLGIRRNEDVDSRPVSAVFRQGQRLGVPRAGALEMKKAKDPPAEYPARA